MAMHPKARRQRWIVRVVVLATALGGLFAGAAEQDPELSMDRLKAMILSHDADTRAAAFRAGRALEAKGNATYRKLLWSAWQKQEVNLAAARRESARACGWFVNSQRNWQAVGRDAMLAVRAEIGGTSEGAAELDHKFEQARRSRLELEARLASALEAVAALNAAIVGFDELERELARCEDRPPPLVEGVRARLGKTAEGRVVLVAETAMLAVRAVRDAHLEATLHNRGQLWAPGPARSFTALLNERRKVLGLEPLRLERRLWEAASRHTAEMQDLGYFAHESPATERRTPGLRARAARFTGSFEGENLYRSERPHGADRVMRSWWLSDAHRVVLFAGRPNAIGLDPGDGTHWTLMTGRSESS